MTGLTHLNNRHHGAALGTFGPLVSKTGDAYI